MRVAIIIATTIPTYRVFTDITGEHFLRVNPRSFSAAHENGERAMSSRNDDV